MNKYSITTIVCLLVILLVSVTGAANPVGGANSDALVESKIIAYDDAGKPITEADIRPYLINNYKTGCCLLGGCVGISVGWGLASVASEIAKDRVDGDMATGIAGSVGVLGAVASHSAISRIGELVDQRDAIEFVKQERRTGQKLSPPKPMFRDGVITAFIVTGIVMLAACATAN